MRRNLPLLKGENKLFELFVIILFCWLAFKAIGLALSLTWGAAKILASLLFAIAVPVLIDKIFKAIEIVHEQAGKEGSDCCV